MTANDAVKSISTLAHTELHTTHILRQFLHTLSMHSIRNKYYKGQYITKHIWMWDSAGSNIENYKKL